jgi:hypothetical protein
LNIAAKITQRFWSRLCQAKQMRLWGPWSDAEVEGKLQREVPQCFAEKGFAIEIVAEE